MTVYSGVRHQSNTRKDQDTVVVTSPGWFKLNLMLLGVCVLGIVVYVGISNQLVKERFSISSEQRELNARSVMLAARESQLTQDQDMENLIALVHTNGMVANGDVKALFITSNVALLP